MKLLGGLLSETASLRLRIRMRDARRDGMSVAQSVRARTFCVDFTYFHIHCEFHCEVKCEMVQSFHCEITFPEGGSTRHWTRSAESTASWIDVKSPVPSTFTDRMSAVATLTEAAKIKRENVIHAEVEVFMSPV